VRNRLPLVVPKAPLVVPNGSARLPSVQSPLNAPWESSLRLWVAKEQRDRARNAQRQFRIRAQSGFSLTELIVVMLIVAILMALGIPSYRYVTYSNRVSSEVNSLLGDLQYARSEAVKEGQMVTVCPTSTGTSCANATSWQTGWIVFSDVNSNQTVAAPANILHVQPAFNSTPQDTFVSNDTVTFVSFNREGFATAFPTGVATGGYVTITLHTTPQNSQWTRCVQIFTTGLMGTETTSDSQGNCT
jgi:type IV fimbrial biogenesis protein FimT